MGAVVLAAVGCDSSTSKEPEREVARQGRPAMSAQRAGSKLLVEDAPPLVVADEPSSYRITYRLEDRAAGGLVITTDDVRVARPHRGRLESFAGAPDDRGELVGGQVSDLTRLSVPSVGSRPALTIRIPPDIAGNDLRFGAILEWAVGQGFLQRRERRSVLDRPCTVYRAGEPVTAGVLTPLLPGVEGADNYADACISDRGILLEEVWVTDGKVLRRKLAVALDEGASLDEADFPISDRVLPEAEGATTIRAVEPASRPEGPFWVLDAPPAGFVGPQRFVVVVPDDSTDRGDAPPDRRKTMASVVDLYVRGVDLLVVDQGGTIGSVQRRGVPEAAPRATAGALGEVGIIPGFRTVEVRAALSGGRFVRVVGTLPPDELVAVAASLRLEPGGGTGVVDLPPAAEDPPA